MFGKRARDTEQLLVTMERQLALIYTALVVRDPGTPVSVDAYEGLRKQVVASSTARRQHLAQLAEIDVALRRGASTENLSELVTQWLRQAGVERVEDPARREVWETRLPSDVAAEVDIPAYVDLQTSTIVRQGRLKENAELAVVESVAAAPIVEEPAARSNDVPVANDLGAEAGEAEATDASRNATPVDGSSAPADDETSEEK